MTVQKGFAFDHSKAARDNAPSSCDGASCESAFDPNTGQRIPGYVATSPPARLSTHGALGDETAHGTIGAYHEAAAASEGIHYGGGPELALPTDVDRFSTTGDINADSNLQSTGTAGGPLADHSLVLREGGSDASAQEAQGFGGRTIA
jgi:hypothetical protein